MKQYIITTTPSMCLMMYHYIVLCFVFAFCLVSRHGVYVVSVLYDGGLLPDIMLLTQCYYHRGTRLNAMKSCFCLCGLCSHLLNALTFSSLIGGCSEGLDALRFFLKQHAVWCSKKKKKKNVSQDTTLSGQTYFKENLNASRPSEHPPVRGENVKTFRWDHRLQINTKYLMGFKRVPRW